MKASKAEAEAEAEAEAWLIINDQCHD